jgi:predicted RNA-binding Zn ribbon-like protein
MIATADTVFSLCGGHPVLDLVNTLDNRFRSDGPDELLPNYRAVLAFMEQSGLLDGTAVATLASGAALVSKDAEQVAEAIRRLRETAATVLYAVAENSTPSPADVRKLESWAHAARQHEELLWSPARERGPAREGSRFVWGWRSVQMQPELPLWMLAAQTAALLTSDALSLLRTCDCETCRWLFLDTSKNHSRRWCDMKVCGNRMKARRFNARRA